MVYSSDMALTIKNPQTISLARDFAGRLGTTQTAAITVALQQALDTGSVDDRAARVDEILHHVWSSASDGDSERVRRNLTELYDEKGLPA